MNLHTNQYASKPRLCTNIHEIYVKLLGAIHHNFLCRPSQYAHNQ
jgi:hypothetical protein